MINPEFWRNRKVLITGHTGFKGAWLSLWLSRLGATISGLSLPPDAPTSLFGLANVCNLVNGYYGNINDKEFVESVMRQVQPTVIFHMAAQSLVRKSYRCPLETFATNIQGSANILNAARYNNKLKVIVMVTTDKVYQNRESFVPYNEEDKLGGHDPYSTSKAASELLINSYFKSYLEDLNVSVVSARSGNVIGGGDWSEDRLLPDAIRAWQANEILRVRNPDSVRPWQHVLEALCGYVSLAEAATYNNALSGAYNFGPELQDAFTVREAVEFAKASFHPGVGVKYLTNNEGPHEARLLTLDISKAKKYLQFKPHWNTRYAIQRTVEWYVKQERGNDVRQLCFDDISDYEKNI